MKKIKETQLFEVVRINKNQELTEEKMMEIVAGFQNEIIEISKISTSKIELYREMKMALIELRFMPKKKSSYCIINSNGRRTTLWGN